MNPRPVITTNRGYTKRSPGNAGYSSPLLNDTDGQYRAWNQSITIATTGGPYVVQDGCFALLFTNIGDTPCKVNGKTLFPFSTVLPLTALGDAFSIGGHLKDLYYGSINVEFFAPIGTLPQLEIIQLYYIGILKTHQGK